MWRRQKVNLTNDALFRLPRTKELGSFLEVLIKINYVMLRVETAEY